MDLLGDGENVTLNINENYAKRYEKWRKSEELQKLKDKYGHDIEESSTSEDEDEDAVELTEQVEENFFKTLSYLKEKNPKIYDDNARFFDEDTNTNNLPSATKGKGLGLSMAAYHRKVLLETGGVIEEDNNGPNIDVSNLPYVEQERALKESFKAALSQEDSDSESELLKPKVKTSADAEKEENEYRLWLAGQTESAPKGSSELKSLRDYWANPKLDEGEKFLRDYILNHRYLGKGETTHADNFLSDSEDDTKEQEEFERKFNFRFEEPDQDFIKRYPRTVEKSMRKVDDRRKKHREEVKERKIRERAQKDEELKRLKSLKRAEIMEKIQKLQEVTGNNMNFMNDDVEGDFDPNEHDRRMSELFNENYYQMNTDDKKPEFPELDEELEIENWNQWNEEDSRKYNSEPHCEDAEFVMDCDYDPAKAEGERVTDNTKRRRKKRHSKFAEALANPKPKFDPTNAKFEQYLDEYYSLNYEDLIGDIPCRFKYRKTVPNDYGLTIEEILAAPDKELNQWASCKKIMRRRPEHVELNEVKVYRTKAKDFNKKKKCLPSLYSAPEADDDATTNHALETNGMEVYSTSFKTETKVQKKKKRRQDGPKLKSELSDHSPVLPPAIAKGKKKRKNGPVEHSTMMDSPKKRKKKEVNPEDTQVNGTKEETPNKGKVSKKLGNKNISGIDTADTMSRRSTVEYWKPPQQSLRKTIMKVKSRPSCRMSGKRTGTKKLVGTDEPAGTSISDSRLKSYGINPKKFKNKLKYGCQVGKS